MTGLYYPNDPELEAELVPKLEAEFEPELDPELDSKLDPKRYLVFFC